MRRLLLILLSPAWLVLALFSLLIGLAFYAETNPAALYVITETPTSAQAERALYLLARVVLFPFQLIFIFLAFAGALWVFRRRQRIAAWVLGGAFVERLSGETWGEEPRYVLRPQRRRTWVQIVSSIIAVLAILLAVVLSLGQFVPRAELAVVIAALTSGLTWGARLPIGDLLGGITNIFETTVAVGDRIRYAQVGASLEGVVESMDLRFLDVRADSGELTTIPHGELRIFRNDSRGHHAGVYATLPVAARHLERAVSLLHELAPESTAIVPQLAAPWQILSHDGLLTRFVDLSVYGLTVKGNEEALRLRLHVAVYERLAAAGVAIGEGPEADA